MMVSQLMGFLKRPSADITAENTATLNEVRANPSGRSVTEKQRTNFALMTVVPGLRRVCGQMPPIEDLKTMVKLSLEIGHPEGPSEVLYSVSDGVKQTPNKDWASIIKDPKALGEVFKPELAATIEQDAVLPAGVGFDL
jgi:hypothetical protein